MTFDELREALETGHKSSSVLRDVLQELVDDHYCPEASGFEGPETYPDCGECVFCLAKRLLKND